MNWLPIETAPKDGTSVLLWGGRLYYQDEAGDVEEEWKIPVVGFWPDSYNSWWCQDYHADGRYIDNPTHWMPLPEPPQEKAP